MLFSSVQYMCLIGNYIPASCRGATRESWSSGAALWLPTALLGFEAEFPLISTMTIHLLFIPTDVTYQLSVLFVIRCKLSSGLVIFTCVKICS